MITVIANLKGGTGKSTVTYNLAVWLASNNRSTAVIDLDPQRTLTDTAALRMEDKIEPAIRVETGSFSDVTFPEDADEIIIDVGTADLESFKLAIMIADRILVPVTPSQADIWSTQRFIRFLNKNTHGNPPETITFLNRVDTSKADPAPEQAAAALSALPVARLIPQRLSARAVFRDSFSESLAVFELEPRSAASSEFRALAEALYPSRQCAVRDRLRKQKISTAIQTSFRQMLETPSEPYLKEKSGDGEVKPASPAETVQQDSKPEQAQKDKKKRKNKKGKKHKKAAKAKLGKKEKKIKNRKKNKKGKKGKKK